MCPPRDAEAHVLASGGHERHALAEADMSAQRAWGQACRWEKEPSHARVCVCVCEADQCLHAPRLHCFCTIASIIGPSSPSAAFACIFLATAPALAIGISLERYFAFTARPAWIVNERICARKCRVRAIFCTCAHVLGGVHVPICVCMCVGVGERGGGGHGIRRQMRLRQDAGDERRRRTPSFETLDQQRPQAPTVSKRSRPDSKRGGPCVGGR